MDTDEQLFDSSGGAASGNKQDAVNGAAGTIMKLMMKSQMTGVSDVHLVLDFLRRCLQ